MKKPRFTWTPLKLFENLFLCRAEIREYLKDKLKIVYSFRNLKNGKRYFGSSSVGYSRVTKYYSKYSLLRGNRKIPKALLK